MDRYVLSDLHLGHRNIHKFRNRPDGSAFRDGQEHDEYVMDMWTTLIPRRSLVYVLGDIAFNNGAVEKFRKLHGTKHVVLGNHDVPACRFGDCCHIAPMFMKSVNGKRIIMTHIPIHFHTLERWEFNIHGHQHDNMFISERHINVCLEAIDFIPRLLEEIVP